MDGCECVCMMNKFSLFILLIPFALYAQEKNSWHAGSASILCGRIYTLSCFVSGPGEEWAYDEKMEMLRLLKESQEWIKKQAFNYGESVDFDASGNYGLKKDIKLDSLRRGSGSGKEQVDLVSRLLYKIGYKSTTQLDAWIRKNAPSDNYQLILFVKGQGIGYAMNYRENMNREKYFVEGAVLYEKYNQNLKLASAGIAHEILHLFGAWDLYKTFQQTEENEQRARKIFPNSIMLRTSYKIDELSIDALTAWRIGWNKYPENWYESFRPKGEMADRGPK